MRGTQSKRITALKLISVNTRPEHVKNTARYLVYALCNGHVSTKCLAHERAGVQNSSLQNGRSVNDKRASESAGSRQPVETSWEPRRLETLARYEKAQYCTVTWLNPSRGSPRSRDCKRYREQAKCYLSIKNSEGKSRTKRIPIPSVCVDAFMFVSVELKF
jgi:hypothetical protein